MNVPGGSWRDSSRRTREVHSDDMRYFTRTYNIKNCLHLKRPYKTLYLCVRDADTVEGDKAHRISQYLPGPEYAERQTVGTGNSIWTFLSAFRRKHKGHSCLMRILYL